VIVVADTSPINYMVQIGAIRVLPSLYRRVVVPAAVWEELLAARTPTIVKSWLAASNDWLEVRSSSYAAPLSASLDGGEAQAIQLALDIKADLVLMDDRRGVVEARRLKLTTTGTVGVLVAAERAGLLNAEDHLKRLLAETNFKCSPAVAQDAFLQIQQIRSGSPR
jgi:predicted nucleic acid-binding protein